MSYVKDVQAWYGDLDPSRWRPQDKTLSWADHVLTNAGVLLRGKDVLNLGCYYPEDEIANAAHCRMTSIDLCPEVIEAARLLAPAATFVVMDMRDLDLPDDSFDVVCDFSSGDHLTRDHYAEALDEVARVLRPGGHFVCVYTNTPAMQSHGIWKPGQETETARFGFTQGNTPEQMRAQLVAHGLGVVQAAHEHLPRAGFLAVLA